MSLTITEGDTAHHLNGAPIHLLARLEEFDSTSVVPALRFSAGSSSALRAG